MSHCDGLTTTIREAFVDEITALGGTLKEVFEQEGRLFARSVLPEVREVLPDDRFQRGVALRAVGGDVCVHPYLFRQVCSNGAILAQSLESSRIEDISLLTPDETAQSVREAVRACCLENRFARVAAGIRSASRREADVLLSLMPLLARLGSSLDASQIVMDILDRFSKDADRSQFGLMNAVTSVARDTRGPETRWRLEEWGGAIVAGPPHAPDLDRGRRSRLAEELELIA